MGAILKVNKLTTFSEVLVIVATVAVVLSGVYFFAPGLRVSASKQLSALNLSNDKVNNVAQAAKLPLPSVVPSTLVASKPINRIGEYAWNGNSGMIVANGGANTTKGSLMEQAGINLQIVPLDGVDDLRNLQIKFIEEFDRGVEFPSSDKSAFAVSIMGDGFPYYETTTQLALDNKFGKGRYHVKKIAAIGLSAGEDKLVGRKEWIANPQLLKGKVISGVIGDGDWVVLVNFCSANKIKINPDPTTYDAEAVNVVPAPNGSYIDAVKDLIKSQKTGYTIPLKEVKNGKLTGKTLNCIIDGAVTWTPGDKLAFDALPNFTDVVSTKDFVNQMSTSIIVVEEWAVKHRDFVVSLLTQTYTANNQIKLYDEWRVKAGACVADAYKFENGKYWYDMFKGQTVAHDTVLYHLGGTVVFNYADALQYFGISDGNNRYQAVYNQVSSYLTDLNPGGFNETCKHGVTPYDSAVDLSFLKLVTVQTGAAARQDYTQNKTEVMANGHWNINFATGSAVIVGSDKDLKTIYNLLIEAEQAKLQVVGYTDNTGHEDGPDGNVALSTSRANAIVNYLTNLGIAQSRFQLVDGRGSQNPVADNATSAGKAKNRRVDITLMK